MAQKIVDHCLCCTKKLSTIVCIVVKTKKYKAPCFLKQQYRQCSTIVKATFVYYVAVLRGCCSVV